MSSSVFMFRKGEAKMFASPADIPQGEGWQDTPVPEGEPQETEAEGTSELDALREHALSLGIKVDGRWSMKKLQTMIAAAESNE